MLAPVLPQIVRHGSAEVIGSVCLGAAISRSASVGARRALRSSRWFSLERRLPMAIAPVEILLPPRRLDLADGSRIGPFLVGEGPTWDAGADRLWFVDIEGKALHALDFDVAADAGLSARSLRSYGFAQKVCSLGLTRSGRILLALADGVYYFTPGTGALELLARPETDKPHNRLNDGKVGPDGAFWVGSMDERPERQPVASLYRITADGRVRKMSMGYKVSNGLAWSADGRQLFHSDSRGPMIDRWQFHPATGLLGERTTVRTLSEEEGRPDGGACDVAGAYWSAGVSAGVLNRFAPDGKLIQKIALPVPAPTMPCFCGPDLQTLIVTSHMQGHADPARAAQADTGSLVILRTSVAGVPVARFADA
jgi:sugar lactone lactonase YvrE